MMDPSFQNNMANETPVSRFDVTKTVIKFDSRIRNSVSVANFRPEMLDEPAVGARSRGCSIEATFMELDRDKGLRMANAEARKLTAKKSGMWTQATVGSTPEGLFWRVAVSMQGEERCEIRVRETRHG
ncbi:MAG: hypothetical protein LQ352_004192 [Teloschistes flavicans]|nr:MAG: hypothetical protein LQ352_004192 [Teloschistes flavicans]